MMLIGAPNRYAIRTSSAHKWGDFGNAGTDGRLWGVSAPTTNVIECCFVEVRRRTRPMVCFVNVESVDRIAYSIFQRFNLEWKIRTLSVFTQAA